MGRKRLQRGNCHPVVGGYISGKGRGTQTTWPHASLRSNSPGGRRIWWWGHQPAGGQGLPYGWVRPPQAPRRAGHGGWQALETPPAPPGGLTLRAGCPARLGTRPGRTPPAKNLTCHNSRGKRPHAGTCRGYFRPTQYAVRGNTAPAPPPCRVCVRPQRTALRCREKKVRPRRSPAPIAGQRPC